jgi:hypothetical protein
VETHKRLLDVAKRQTGLDDFGVDSFREGLEILVNALRREANLNARGEAVLRDRIVGHLSQRLQVEDWYRRFPEIDEEPLVAPLIGISLPRTGSTVLSCLLAQDPGARSLRRAEAASPCPPPAMVSDAGRSAAQPLASRAEGLKPHVPSGEDAPAECQDLMALDFKSQIFQAFAQIPSYSDWLLDADLTSTYVYERRTLKLLQWRRPAQPWRLKCPTHLVYLEHLDRAFPDARFVMTHRAPSEVIPSVIDVYCDIAGTFTDTLDAQYLAELNLHHWSVGMRRALAFRDTAGREARFHDIDFPAMNDDPIEQVRGLYRWLGEPVSEAFAAGMARWWRQNAESREASAGRGRFQYAIDEGRMHALFADYTQRLGLAGQGKARA